MAKTNTPANALKIAEIDSAISSWSGFIYQGKVALYHVLTLLNGGNAKSGYELQLDSLEDFAILASGNKPVSMHQIKALKSQAYNTYKQPFEKLVKHGNQHGCTKLSFHTARPITDKTIAQIETDHPPMKVYTYGTNSYCGLSEIDKLIEEQINVYYLEHSASDATPGYVQLTRNVMEDLILERVIKAHSNIHLLGQSENESAYKERIPFTKIEAVLTTDLRAQASSEQYFLALTRKDLAAYFQEYCLENEPKIDYNCKAKLKKFMIFMNAMDSAQMVFFIRGLMPHRRFRLNSIHDYKNDNIQKDEMQKAFFHCMMTLPEILVLIFNQLSWSDGVSNTYSPTSILYSDAHLDDTCADIIKNIMETDVELPFQTNRLITREMEVGSVYHHANNITEITDSDLKNQEEKKITKWKQIALVPIEKAKSEIK